MDFNQNLSCYNFICWKLGHSAISRPWSVEETNALLVGEKDSIRSQLDGIVTNETDGIARSKTKPRKAPRIIR